MKADVMAIECRLGTWMYPAAVGGERAAKITLFAARTRVVTGSAIPSFN